MLTSYLEVNEYMKRYSGRVCSLFCSSTEDRVAAYDFTGCDYALVLFASFPSHCINLNELNWSLSPLTGQEKINLNIFCEAALSLHLANTPELSLTPSHLHPCVADTMHHIQVQYWLYTLHTRFPPSTSFNPYNTRIWLRWRQTGEPLLASSKMEEIGKWEEELVKQNNNTVISTSSSSTYDSTFSHVARLIANDRQHACKALSFTTPVEMKYLQKSAPYLREVPRANSEYIKSNTSNVTVHVTASNVKNDTIDKNNKSKQTDETALMETRQRPRDYARPWRQPLNPSSASSFVKEKSITVNILQKSNVNLSKPNHKWLTSSDNNYSNNNNNNSKKRSRVESESNNSLCPCSYLTAYIPFARNLQEQYVLSKREANLLQSRLSLCFNMIYDQLLGNNNNGDDVSDSNRRYFDIIFSAIAEQLQQIDLSNSQTIRHSETIAYILDKFESI